MTDIKTLEQKLKSIKIFLTDVDGVLTDGGMYYTTDGLHMKKFYVRDGMGSGLLKKAGILTGLISSDKSTIGQVRAERLQFDYIYIGLWEKPAALEEICTKAGVTYNEVAFIGDDVNDLEILKLVGFSAAPADADAQVRSIVDYVCKNKGGEGAYREVADLILKHNK